MGYLSRERAPDYSEAVQISGTENVALKGKRIFIKCISSFGLGFL